MLRGIYFQSEGGFFGIVADPSLPTEFNPRCVLVEIDWVDDSQVMQTEYLSNLGYTTGTDDSPTSACYHDLIVQAPTISARIDAALQLGQLTVRNPLSEFDPGGTASLADWYLRAWRGHGARLFIGDPTWSRASFQQFFNGVIESISMDGDGTMTFAIADRGLLLQETVTKDFGFYGKVFNAEPVYVGAGQSDTYQLDSITAAANRYFAPHYFSALGAFFVLPGIYEITEVRDNGAPVSFTPLESNRKIELDVPPAGVVTFDAIKSKNYAAGAVIRAMAADAGVPESYLNIILLDQAALGVGYVIAKNQTLNYMDMLQAIAQSAGGYLQWGWSGQLEFYFIDIAKPAVLDIGIDDMTSDGVKIEGVEDPLYYLKLGYKKNWRVQDYNSLAGIAQVDASPYTVEYQYLAQDNGVSNQYPLPLQNSVDTLIADPADASIEFQRRLNQRAKKTLRLSVECFNLLTSLKLGSNVTLSYPRLGISALHCAIIGIELNPNTNKTGLSLWAYVLAAGGGGGGGLQGGCTAIVKIPFDKWYVWIPAPPPGHKSYKPNAYWDFNNVVGTLHCQNIYQYGDGSDAPVIATAMNDYKTSALPNLTDYRTVRIIYHTSGSPVFYVSTSAGVVSSGYVQISTASKHAYFNIAANVQLIFFNSTAWRQTGSGGQDYGNGEVFIECVDILVRDWQAAGENAFTMYYS